MTEHTHTHAHFNIESVQLEESQRISELETWGSARERREVKTEQWVTLDG